MPGAAIMELSCEATMAYCNANSLRDVSVIGLRTFQINRGISFPEYAPRKLRLCADPMAGATPENEPSVIRVRVFSDVMNRKGVTVRENVLHAIAEVEIAKRRPMAPHFDVALPASIGHFYVPKPALYETFIKTHGPLLSSLTGRVSVYEGEKSTISQFEMGGLESGFVRDYGNGFIVSPLAIDSAFQVNVMWVFMKGLGGRVPVGCKGFKVYGVPHPKGCYYAHVENLKVDDNESTSRIYIFDGAGTITYFFDEVTFRKSDFNAWGEFQQRTEFRLESYRVEEPIFSENRQA
jgi:hypothetical protein